MIYANFIDKGNENGGAAGAHEDPEIGYLFSSLKIGYKPIRVRYLMTGADYLKEQETQEASQADVSGTASNEMTDELKESISDDALIVKGSGFNESSRIMVDNRPKDTILLGEDAQMLKGDAPEENSVISVGQFDENLKLVGSCVNLVSYPQLGRPGR